MYDKHIIVDGSLSNLSVDGRLSGFSLGIRLPYYRGQPFSVVEDLAVTVDGRKYDRAALRFGVRGHAVTLDQMEGITDQRWEFGEVATLSVAHEGGLAAGPREVTLAVQLRISYLPWSSVTSTTKTMSTQQA